MPFMVTVSRESDDPETLTIESIVDRNDNEINPTNLEIHIQSLGAEER